MSLIAISTHQHQNPPVREDKWKNKYRFLVSFLALVWLLREQKSGTYHMAQLNRNDQSEQAAISLSEILVGNHKQQMLTDRARQGNRFAKRCMGPGFEEYVLKDTPRKKLGLVLSQAEDPDACKLFFNSEPMVEPLLKKFEQQLPPDIEMNVCEITGSPIKAWWEKFNSKSFAQFMLPGDVTNPLAKYRVSFQHKSAKKQRRSQAEDIFNITLGSIASLIALASFPFEQVMNQCRQCKETVDESRLIKLISAQKEDFSSDDLKQFLLQRGMMNMLQENYTDTKISVNTTHEDQDVSMPTNIAAIQLSTERVERVERSERGRKKLKTRKGGQERDLKESDKKFNSLPECDGLSMDDKRKIDQFICSLKSTFKEKGFSLLRLDNKMFVLDVSSIEKLQDKKYQAKIKVALTKVARTAKDNAGLKFISKDDKIYAYIKLEGQTYGGDRTFAGECIDVSLGTSIKTVLIELKELRLFNNRHKLR